MAGGDHHRNRHGEHHARKTRRRGSEEAEHGHRRRESHGHSDHDGVVKPEPVRHHNPHDDSPEQHESGGGSRSESRSRSRSASAPMYDRKGRSLSRASANSYDADENGVSVLATSGQPTKHRRAGKEKRRHGSFLPHHRSYDSDEDDPHHWRDRDHRDGRKPRRKKDDSVFSCFWCWS